MHARPSSRAVGRLFLLLFLLSLSTALTPTVAGQFGLVTEDRVFIALQPAAPFVEVARASRAEVPIQVDDETALRSLGGTPAGGVPRIVFEAEILTENATGWTASVTPPSVFTLPGRSHQVSMVVQRGPSATAAIVVVRVNATWYFQDVVESFTVDIVANAVQDGFINALLSRTGTPVSPGDFGEFRVEVTNLDVFPDMVGFQVVGPDGFKVLTPAPVSLAPGETREVVVAYKAPGDIIWKYSSTETFSIRAQSLTDPTAFREMSAAVRFGGGNLPPWITPQLAFALFALIVGMTRIVRSRTDHAAESGAPQYPGIPPEEAAALLVLKKTDRAQYNKRKAALKQRHRERKREYRHWIRDRHKREGMMARTERQRHDLMLEKQRLADAEVARKAKALESQKKKLKAAKRREAKKDKKAAAREAKAQGRIDKVERKQAKRVEKKEKAVAKKQAARKKKLDKRAAAKEKRQAKVKAAKLEKLSRKKARLEKAARRKAKKGGKGK